MPDASIDKIRSYIAELDARAAKSQQDARDRLNPLFRKRDERKPGPGAFVESSFLYMRSCDADTGSRPMPCPVFWLSPDLRVAPLSNLGAATRELRGGDSYRLTATVRNRGDLMVPSAKVEFWLVTPSLGFDVRFATKIGVAAGRVQAHGAAEISLDYAVPPALAGHRCLFARVFSFSPLDIPVDDHALSPGIDRHVAQLNLTIVAQATSISLDWVHLRNAAERLEIAPMDAATLRGMRLESVTELALVPAARMRDMLAKIEIEVRPDKEAGTRFDLKRGELGVELFSADPDAVSLDRQAALFKQVEATLAKRVDADRSRKLLAEFRAMTGQTVRTTVRLTLPDMGLKPRQAVPLQILRRDIATNRVTGGVALLVTGGA